MTDSLYVNFGGLDLPLDPNVATDTLVSLDPARTVMLQLFAAAINAELGARWATVTATLPPKHFLQGTKPVQQTLELQPNADTLGQVKVDWPLLALCRIGEGKYDEITLYSDRLTQKWELSYILGAIPIAEQHKLGDLCVAAAKIVATTIRNGAHPAYENGAVQFFPDKAGLAYVHLAAQEGPGQSTIVGKNEEAATYYSISLQLETWETTSENLDGYEDNTGADFSIGLDTPAEGDPLEDFIEASID